MNGLLGNNIDKIRRSNRILHKKRFVQYPFENDLSKLPPEDLDYCVNGFLHNPYENYNAQNMLQFFLKTFGEGITNTYLRPYNEKIWKFDPSFMDTQMVNRIPKPPKEDTTTKQEPQLIWLKYKWDMVQARNNSTISQLNLFSIIIRQTKKALRNLKAFLMVVLSSQSEEKYKK